MLPTDLLLDKLKEAILIRDHHQQALQAEHDRHINAPDTPYENEQHEVVTPLYVSSLAKADALVKKWQRLLNPKPPSTKFKHDIPTLKTVPIKDLLPDHDHLKEYGNRITLRCPFHEEKTPSFVIFKDKNNFHCFGCQAHGSVIDFVMLQNNTTFAKALQILEPYL